MSASERLVHTSECGARFLLWIIAMVKAQVILTQPRSTPDAAKRAVKRGLDRSAKLARERVQAKVIGWKTRPRFTIKNDSVLERTVATDNLIFHFQDAGTKPHIIRPRRRRFLRFVPRGGSGFVFARQVNHPGTDAQRWTTTIAAQTERDMPGIFDEEFTKELRCCQ